MFYRQSIRDIKLVIFTLDGGLLDINRLRFNYFKRLCKQNNKTITKEKFTETLGNMYTMYACSPLYAQISSRDINDAMEEELFSYVKAKPNILKEGVEEVLQFFKRRNIKMAVVSTHKTKRAVEYLQLANLDSYFDFVIGGDSEYAALPEPALLDWICHRMAVTPNTTLVFANFPNMVLAANASLMNVIYIPDLAPLPKELKPNVYQVMDHIWNIINTILFAKYDSTELFSPLLGMSREMDEATLNHTYQKLMGEYGEDEELAKLVTHTYRYFLAEVQAQKEEEMQSKPLNTESKISQSSQNKKFIDEDETAYKKNRLPKIVALDPVQKAMRRQKDFANQANALNTLMDTIQGQEEDPIEEDVPEPTKENSKKNNKTLAQTCLDALYATIIAAVFVLFCMIFYAIFQDFLHSNNPIAVVMITIIDFYIQCIHFVFRGIFNCLHIFIHAIPDYSTLLSDRSFSKTAIETILYIIFHIVLFYIIKSIIRGIRRRDTD